MKKIIYDGVELQDKPHKCYYDKSIHTCYRDACSKCQIYLEQLCHIVPYDVEREEKQ